MIVKNRLLNFKNKIIYQDDESFLLSLDSLLLSNFVTLKFTDKKIIDLCTGNAPIPMLLSFRTKAVIEGVEIQKKIYDLGKNSVKENGMNNQISLFNDDIKNLLNKNNFCRYDVVVSNPPYFKYKKDSLVNYKESKMLARHEVMITLEDVVKIASYLLKNGGVFSLVHRPDRFMEIIFLMKKYNIEPKKVRFVYPKINKEANLLLIEGNKNGKVGLKVLPPLIIYNDDNEYNVEVREMFGD